MRPGLRDDLVEAGFPEAHYMSEAYCEELAKTPVGSWALLGLRFRRALEPLAVVGVKALIRSVRISRRLVGVLTRR